MADGALLIGPTIITASHQHRRFDKRSAIEHSGGQLSGYLGIGKYGRWRFAYRPYDLLITNINIVGSISVAPSNIPVGNCLVIWGLGNMADGALLIGPTIY